jgi:hypothetical protein
MEAAMADHVPGEPSRGEPRPAGGAGLSKRAATRRPGYWFPLLLPGGLIALALPLSVLASPRLPTGPVMLTREVYPTVTQAMYFGGGSVAGPLPFPLGWYWVGALVAALLLTVAWYCWQDRRSGTRTPLRGYLLTGLVLVVATAALPLLAWGMPAPVQMDGSSAQAWTWLDALWQQGTFALLAMAVSLGILARIGHSRGLAVITAIYAAAVCLTGWLNLQQAQGLILPAFYPSGDPAVLLPAAVLLLAGLGTLLTTGLRQRRARGPGAGITAKIAE